MASLFLKIFNMSMVADWVILAVILLRLLLRRAPKWLTCALWAVVALRLICPFSIESIFSLIPSAEIISPTEIQFSASPTINTGIPVINNTLNPVIQDSLAAAPEASVNPMQIWIFAGRVIWVIGLIVMLGYAAVSFLRIRRMLEEAVAFQDNVYLCDAVNSPFIFGLLHPGIYLPSDIDEGQLDYVLAHERVHLKRWDHVWKTLGYFLLAVYWFNPLVWVAYILLCRDIELACDERVVHDLDLNGRKAYSEALVACSTKRRMITFCPLAFGEVGIKERVKTVLNYKKPKFWLVTTAVVACMITAVCFLTNPQKDSETEGMLNAQNKQENADITEINKAENEQQDPKIAAMIEAEKKQLELKEKELQMMKSDLTEMLDAQKEQLGSTEINLWRWDSSEKTNAQNEQSDKTEINAWRWDSSEIAKNVQSPLQSPQDATEMIETQKEQLAEQILTMYQETYSGEYSITGPKLVVKRTAGKRADCLFAANWIMTYKPMDNPWIQGMYQAAENLTDEGQKAYALDIADGWVREIELCWPKEEYQEIPVVIIQEKQSFALYKPYTMNGVETLIPLQEYLDGRKTDEQIYQDGMNVIAEAVRSTFPEDTDNVTGTASPKGNDA